MRRMLAPMVMLASALALAACGGGGSGGTGPITIVTGSIAYFVVRGPTNRDTVQVVPPGQVQLAGAAFDANLNPVALVGDTTWTSRDTTVAKVDAHGLVTTAAVGNVWVIGTFQPKASSSTFSDSVLVQALGQQ